MVELFILLCMIFGIMAPIFVPIVGGIVWGLFITLKFLFIPIIGVSIIYLVLEWKIMPKKECRGTLLYERAQLEKERDRLVREKEYNNRPWPQTVRRTYHETGNSNS